ncbi:MAG: hypothetical protein WBO37_00605 [Gammaproteobacteria bacterium]
MKQVLIVISLLITSVMQPLMAGETADTATKPLPAEQPADTSGTGNGGAADKQPPDKKAAAEEEPDCE